MTTILTAIVGSHLHGTAVPASDTDIRGVFMVPLRDIISPFRTVPKTTWSEGDADNTRYELRTFCRLAAQGNPLALETISAPPLEITPQGEALRALLPSFLSRQCITSFFNYARNHERKFRDSKDQTKWKYAATEVRTLHQLLTLLTTGDIQTTYPGDLILLLRAIRAGDLRDADILATAIELEVRCQEAAITCTLPEEPDIGRIEQFLMETYRQ